MHVSTEFFFGLHEVLPLVELEVRLVPSLAKAAGHAEAPLAIAEDCPSTALARVGAAWWNGVCQVRA